MRYGTKWPVYAKSWDGMVIKPSRFPEFEAIAKKILASKARYQAVERNTGVKWYHIAVLHTRESNGNFNTYLGNGQPLNRVTTIVPKGRGPFQTFEAGAVDALTIDGLTKVQDWRLEKILYYCEIFNGGGYDARGLPSPYIWGGTNIQKPGKYVSDGVFDSTVMDTQPGCAPILATLAKMDPTIQFVRETAPGVAASVPVPPPVLSPPIHPAPTKPVVFQGFCIRGLLSIFVSRAMENLTVEINSQFPNGTMAVSDHGYWFSYFSNVGWLTEQCRSIHNNNKRIVLIGHSFGASAAIMVAQRLNGMNVPVELLCPIDPAAQYPDALVIPSNVHRVIGFFQKMAGQLGQGVDVPGKGWSKADWQTHASDTQRYESHLAIADDPFVHGAILAAIKEMQ